MATLLSRFLRVCKKHRVPLFFLERANAGAETRFPTNGRGSLARLLFFSVAYKKTPRLPFCATDATWRRCGCHTRRRTSRCRWSKDRLGAFSAENSSRDSSGARHASPPAWRTCWASAAAETSRARATSSQPARQFAPRSLPRVLQRCFVPLNPSLSLKRERERERERASLFFAQSAPLSRVAVWFFFSCAS